MQDLITSGALMLTATVAYFIQESIINLFKKL